MGAKLSRFGGHRQRLGDASETSKQNKPGAWSDHESSGHSHQTPQVTAARVIPKILINGEEAKLDKEIQITSTLERTKRAEEFESLLKKTSTKESM